jgi:hypothetical protein
LVATHKDSRSLPIYIPRYIPPTEGLHTPWASPFTVQDHLYCILFVYYFWYTNNHIEAEEPVGLVGRSGFCPSLHDSVHPLAVDPRAQCKKITDGHPACKMRPPSATDACGEVCPPASSRLHTHAKNTPGRDGAVDVHSSIAPPLAVCRLPSQNTFAVALILVSITRLDTIGTDQSWARAI